MKIWHYCSLTEWKVDFSQFQNISWSFYFFEERPVVRCIRSQLPQCHVDSREGLGQLDQLLANLKNKKGGKRGDDVSECRRCTWSLTRHSSFSYRITKDLQPTWKQWRFLWWWRKSIKNCNIRIFLRIPSQFKVQLFLRIPGQFYVQLFLRIPSQI